MSLSVPNRIAWELVNADLDTPAFVFDEQTAASAARAAHVLASEAGSQLLYSLKAYTGIDALCTIRKHVIGFSTSSLFETRLARETLGKTGTVHFTSPGLSRRDSAAIAEIADYVTFNSISQWQQFRTQMDNSVSCGLRLNPDLSFVPDSRYDPCRPGSKLGAAASEIVTASKSGELGYSIDGIHFHSNSDSGDFHQLYATCVAVRDSLSPGFLSQIEWINLGGGYLFSESTRRDLFCEAVNIFRSICDCKIFVEPGADLVRNSGFLVATVVDLFVRAGRHVAVLDTTVNHFPEVFEYQFEPDVFGDTSSGAFEYILAGASCLAGDVFGEYAFDEPLCVGAKVVFTGAGAYSMVKAHMFNGINLPSLYHRTSSGDLMLKRAYGYADFIGRQR